MGTRLLITIILTSFICYQSFASNTISYQIPSDGLVFWAKLNEQNGTRSDDSVFPQSNSTVFQNMESTDWTSAGILLDGVNEGINFGNVIKVGTATFTLSCWFKRLGNGDIASTGSGGQTTLEPLIAKLVGEGDGSNLDGNYAMGINQTSLVLVGDFESTLASSNNNPISSDITVINNVWHHGVYRHSMSLGRSNLFYDGILVATTTTSQTPRFDSIQQLGIGRTFNSSGTGDGSFNGEIRDALIYNRALNDSEIYNLFKAGRARLISTGSTVLKP